jgi:glucose/arabinose dehydrogenase
MGPRIVAAVIVALLFGACGGNDGRGGLIAQPTAPLASPPGPAGTALPASTAPAATTTPVASDATGPLPQVKLQRLGTVGFRQMTGMYELPGTPARYLVLEKQGRVMAFEAGNPERAPTVFLDIQDRVEDSSSETGLLGLALSPDFTTSRVFYLNYTAGGPLRTVVSRFTANMNLTAANAGGETKIIEIPQPFTNHNGGEVRFGPDGMLYIGMGDGGSARDPQGNGQNRNALLGKMLRIDVSGSDGGRAYRIPPDNPLAGQQGVREEIWALGMRNPWRFSFDRQTGALWTGDVGQNAREEVDLIKKGANYGWNILEGTQCLSGGSNCNRTGLEPPVIEYPTAGSDCAVVGGFVYRGEGIPALRGAYVYGDYCSGKIWALRYDGSRVTEQAQIASMSGAMSSFAEDSRGEIYALSFATSGGVFKLVP